MDIICKQKDFNIKKLSTSVYLYVSLYIAIYFLSQFILNSHGLVYLQWFQYVSYTLMGLGIIAGTFQWIITGYKTDGFRMRIGVLLLIIEVVVALGIIVVFYIFNKFYVEYRYGQGMAAAVILFILILIFTMIQNYVLKKISK